MWLRNQQHEYQQKMLGIRLNRMRFLKQKQKQQEEQERIRKQEQERIRKQQQEEQERIKKQQQEEQERIKKQQQEEQERIRKQQEKKMKEVKYDLCNNRDINVATTKSRYDELCARHKEVISVLKVYPGAKEYYNLFFNAKRCGVERLTVCEEDCTFPNGFLHEYNIVHEFLNLLPAGSWDIFAGAGNLPENMVIRKIHRFKGMTFLEINKINSTVLNIYNKCCYDKLLPFENNNTIGQFIKNNKFNIVIPYPFIVSSNSNLNVLNVKKILDAKIAEFESATYDIPVSKTTKKTLVLFVFHIYNDLVKKFIKNGIFQDPNVDFIIIVNDKTSTINVPPYVKVLKRDNVGFDFGGWSDGLLINNLYQKYDNFIFANSSIIGPFMHPAFKGKWTDIYLGGLTGNVKLFGSSINTINDPLKKSHVQSYIFCMDKVTLQFLIDQQIFSLTNYAKSFHEAIQQKEILLSRKIIEKGWNIGCLMKYYKGVDFTFKHKQPKDYPMPFLEDLMYDANFENIWTLNELVFPKGNRKNLSIEMLK